MQKQLKLSMGVLIAIVAIAVGSAIAASKKPAPQIIEPIAEHTTLPTATPTPEATPTPTDPRFLEFNDVNAPLNGEDKEGATFGLLKSVAIAKNGTVTIGVDEAYWLGGDEAIAQATKDFKCNTKSPIGPCNDNGTAELPNPFYIYNATPKTLNYTLAADAQIKSIALGYSLEYGLGIMTATPEELKTLVEKQKDIPVWMKLTGKTITYMEEQYLP